MPSRETEALLRQIRAAVLELRRLEGDGVDGLLVMARRREVERLKSRLAELVSRDLVAA